MFLPHLTIIIIKKYIIKRGMDMERKRLRVKNLTERKIFKLNKDFNNVVKLKKLRKSKMNKDYYYIA